MAVAYLDTNVAVWLHYSKLRKITKEARRVIESRDLLISPMVYLEFDNLRRLGRVQHTAAEIYSYLNSSIGVHRCQLPFETVTEFAIDNAWTTDPFDKIIVAQAQANHNAPLITSDSNITAHYRQAVW